MTDIILILVISIAGTYTLKFQVKLMPTKYFHFSRLIDGIEEDISFFGAMVRTFTPIVFGFIFGLIAIQLNFQNSVIGYGALVGFLIIFFLIWPDFLNPEFRTPYIKRNKGKLYLLYFILLLAFPVLGAIGGQVGKLVIYKYPDFIELIDAKAIINSLLVMIIWSLSALIIKYIANSFRETSQ